MNRPRPVLAALAGVAAILSLAACGSTSPTLETGAGAVTPSSATTTTTTPAATTTTAREIPMVPYSPDGEYRALMVRFGLPPESALEAGHASCNALDAGVDFDTLTVIAINAIGYDKVYAAGQVIGAAVRLFCPEHQPQVDAYVAANGS